MKCSGYTLVELLVVAAIVAALVLTTALAWRHDPSGAVEQQARRLAGQVELALARSRVSSDRIALSATPERYAFWRRVDEVWRPIEAGGALDSPPLGGTRIEAFAANGVYVAWGERFVLSETEPFTIALAGHGMRYVVTSGRYAGRVEVRRSAEPPP